MMTSNLTSTGCMPWKTAKWASAGPVKTDKTQIGG